MSRFSFRTIQNPSEGIYKEKGSKFLAFAFPVSDESQIKEIIGALKKKYFDARHHCFAWMLGTDLKQFRAFDDGEPNHSAGDPILGQIRSKDITNVLVVVVRYFGGVKLGVGGLIAAYKAAAEDAINQANIIEKEIKEVHTLQFAYNSMPEVMRMVKEFDLEIIRQHFAESCEIVLSVSLQHREKMFDKVKLLQALGTRILWSEKP